MRKLMNLIKGEEGVTAIEYGLIAAGIGIAIVTTIGLVGDQLVETFNEVVSALQQNPGSG
jgi:pilus assembly protein Flp/PilA